METQARLRPELRPVWTGQEQHDDQPSPSTYSARSPTFPASARRGGLPSPMYPASPGYDQSMRMHERALVDRLDQPGRRESRESPTTARPLSPISEQPLSARRVSVVSLPLPNAPAPSPRSPGFPVQRQTLVAETRSILLSGLPDGLPRPHPTSVDTTAERRQSLPSTFSRGRRSSQQQRQELQAWGHVYFNVGSEANCFVSALALPRRSESSSADEGGAAKGRPSEGGNIVTVRARVRPCALDRKPFILKREFDMDELRATVPELSPVSSGARRPSAEFSRRNPLPAGRRHSSIATNSGFSLDLDKSPIRSTNTIPIRKLITQIPVIISLHNNR